MNHERLFAGAIFGDVFESEALRQIEVELNGGELPEAADGVHQLDVNLGAVEGGFAGHGLVFDLAALEDVLQ